MGQKYERVSFIMTTITHGKGDDVIEMLRDKGISYNMAAVGYTAIGLELADYFGLTEIKRDIIMSIVPERRVSETLTMLKFGFSLDEKRTGLAFAIPVSSVAGLRILQYISGANEIFLPPQADENGKDGQTMKKDYEGTEYRLIITIVARGYADTVVDAAKTAGARGGTVLYARGSGVHDTEKFMNIPIEPEKEIIMTLVKKPVVKEVTKAIMAAAGLDQEGRGICFSLPVTDAIGTTATEAPDPKDAQ